MKVADITTRIRPELLARVVLVVLNGAVTLLAAPVWVTAPLALLTLAVVSERVARHRDRGPLDSVLIAIVGCFAVLILLGVALNFLPGGITARSWAVGVTVVGLVALGLCVGRPAPPSLMDHLRGAPRPGMFAVVAAAVGATVVVGVVVASVFTANAVRVDPVALSATEPAGVFVDVTIDGGSSGGDFDLIRTTGDLTVVVGRDVRVAPFGRVTFTVEAYNVERTELQLYRTGTSEPLRTLVVDRTLATR